MRKLSSEDFAWLFSQAQTVNQSIEVENLGAKAFDGEVIDIFNVHNFIHQKMKKVLSCRFKSKHTMAPWQLESTVYLAKGHSISAKCVLLPENTETLVNALLKPAMMNVQDNPEACAIQLCFQKDGSKEWENFLFYIA